MSALLRSFHIRRCVWHRFRILFISYFAFADCLFRIGLAYLLGALAVSRGSCVVVASIIGRIAPPGLLAIEAPLFSARYGFISAFTGATVAIRAGFLRASIFLYPRRGGLGENHLSHGNLLPLLIRRCLIQPFLWGSSGAFPN